MILVTLDSFIGKYALARTDDTDPTLQTYIDTYEKSYILRLLGVELGKIVIDELVNHTGSGSDGLDPRIEAIVNAFEEQDSTGAFIDWNTGQQQIFQSLGLKDLLTALIFFHYVHEEQVQHGQSGVAIYIGETLSVLKPREAIRLAERKWNSALKSVDAIQWYCKFFKPDEYPEFKGLEIRSQNNSTF
jgi:hypothetical protein